MNHFFWRPKPSISPAEMREERVLRRDAEAQRVEVRVVVGDTVGDGPHDGFVQLSTTPDKNDDNNQHKIVTL
jgi:hypothetical protein